MKKIYDFFYKLAAIVFVFGLLYMFYHVSIDGNVLQSITSFAIGATIAVVLVSLAHISHSSDDNMYEVAIADLQNQLREAENNYDLMRISNQSLYNDKHILEKDVERQAGIIEELTTKYQQIIIEVDSLKAERIRLKTIGTRTIDDKGKIV